LDRDGVQASVLQRCLFFRIVYDCTSNLPGGRFIKHGCEIFHATSSCFSYILPRIYWGVCCGWSDRGLLLAGR